LERLSRDLEFVRPMRTYLVPAAWHVLADFGRAHPAISKVEHDHDARRNDLQAAANSAHDDLVGRPEFLDLVNQHLSRYLPHAASEMYPRGGVPVDKFPSLVAEHVINRIQELPSNYSDRDFWSMFGADFRALGVGASFEKLLAATQSLLTLDRQLLHQLDDIRFELVEQYDIPAAPVDET